MLVKTDFGKYNPETTEIDLVRSLIVCMAQCLVDQPGAVALHAIEQDGGVLYRLIVAPDDVGKVIGKQGRMARSIRTILTAAGNKLKQKLSLDIV